MAALGGFTIAAGLRFRRARDEDDAVFVAERARFERRIVEQAEALGRANEDLAVAEARRQGLIDAAIDPMVTTDVEARILECNGAATAALRGALVGKNLGDLVVLPAAIDREGKGLRHHVSSGNFAIFGRPLEVRARRVDGSDFPAQLWLSPIDAGGRRLVAASLHDLSLRRREQEELETARSLRIASSNSSADGILSADNAGRITSSNRKFEQLFDVPPELANDGDELAALVALVCSRLKEPRVFELQLDWLRRNPESEVHGLVELANGRLLEHSSVPVRSSGRLVGRVWSFRDITERRRSAEKNRALVDAIPDSMVLLGSDGVVREFHGGKECFNPIVGRAAGQPLAALLPLEQAAGMRAAAAEALSTNVAQIYEYALDRDAQVRDFEARLVPSGPSETLAIIRDVSERKLVDRMKNEFISVVSHELRTPLTSIRGSLGLLKAGVAGPLGSQVGELIGIAHSNSERLVRLINDILDIEKIEAGKLELSLSDLDPARLVQTTLDGLGGLAEQSMVRLRSEVTTTDHVRGDEDRLVQVLTNLVSNAIKFSPPDGDVAVRAERTAAGWLRFEVRDRGPGIAAEHLGKLFGKFQQLDSSDSRRKGGTGLGLAISKAIVEKHGGRVGVTTEVGQGSTFWVELPPMDI